MLPSRFTTRFIAWCVTSLLLALAAFACAQDGVSTAGEARAKYLGNLGVLPASREVVVEDFINYHRHEIARPKAGEAVAMDVRWGSDTVSGNRDAILQVGFSTALTHDREHIKPLNLSIVIDKSGSMADYNKLTRVKSALLALVTQLRETDVLSIVVFDSEARVLLPAEEVLDKEHVKSLIREIQPGSATNLSGGLLLGYEEAMKHYRKDASNRVILLTDGIANRGITDPGKIAQASASYNDRGIDLSTIGVGLDLNKDLLRTLAKSGRGLFHFVADSEDIQKVFVSEFQSLVAPAASEPNLEVDFGPDLRLEKVFGYEPHQNSSSVKLKLDNMNSGMTEVVLLKFKPRSEDSDSSRLPVTVHLSYFDLSKNEEVKTSQTAYLNLAEGKRENGLDDDSVEKNYTIAELAQSIHDMAADCEEKRYRDGERVLNSAVEKATNRYPSLEDPDIKRTLTIAQKYQAVLREQNGDSDSGGDEDRPIEQPRGRNIVPNGDFSQGNRGFDSPGLAYTAPTENSLWPAGYTVAPSFNNPQLHRLVPADDFAAPKRPNGNEEVLYANAGGAGSLVVWSTVVKCRPNTTYRISFQGISLSGGVEWTPTFEIRANGDRSEPQQAGAGSFSEITSEWQSGSSREVTLTIVRMPIPHGGGLIGISNIEMIPVR